MLKSVNASVLESASMDTHSNLRNANASVLKNAQMDFL